MSAERRPRLSIRRRGAAGQSLVEFALIGSLAIVVIAGTIAGAYLFFMNSAVGSAARGGSRWATIETGLYTGPAGSICESGLPDTIVHAAQASGNVLPVNPAHLCAVSATELQQSPVDPTRANIVVDALPSLASPSCVTVTVTYLSKPVAVPFLGTITLQAHSSMPFPVSVSSSSTTSGTLQCPGPGQPIYPVTTTTSSSTSSTSASSSTTTTVTSTSSTSATSTSVSSSSSTTSTSTTTASTTCWWSFCWSGGG
ncbi:MAG TPA: TadE family protein [Candidatus Dormibacteraeota bacterium]